MLTFTYHGLACVELEFAVRLLLNPGTSPQEELELLATLNPEKTINIDYVQKLS